MLKTNYSYSVSRNYFHLELKKKKKDLGNIRLLTVWSHFFFTEEKDKLRGNTEE